jgi:hypothetical protein
MGALIVSGRRRTLFLSPAKEEIMAQFNKSHMPHAPASTRATSVLTSQPTPTLRTHEGGLAHQRDERSELFLTVTSGMITEDSFYETGDQRVARVRQLVLQIATDVGAMQWLYPFVQWLRREGNMRSAPIVIAAETVYQRLLLAETLQDEPGAPTLRELVAAALDRADEPGEFLAYWRSRFGGGTLPKPVKRGVADAVNRLYSEFSLLKYDSTKAGYRFGDVISLTRPTPKADQVALFRHAIERRHASWENTPVPEALLLLHRRAELEAVPVAERRKLARTLAKGQLLKDILHDAGATWEWLSGWLADGQGMDAEAWEWVIPQMGYMALLRNLANFDRAGVSDKIADKVIERLRDPEQVRRSRQFPFRFLSAYHAAPSDRWKHPLSVAMSYSVANLPELDGRSLILIDTSGSMTHPMSAKSSVSMIEAAALFGVALGMRNQGRVDVYGFADYAYGFQLTRGQSLGAAVQAFAATSGSAGYGTNIPDGVRQGYAGHDRVFIFSDMQTVGYYDRGVDAMVPKTVPIYAFNLNASQAAAIPSGSGNRFELGGLTDATFRMIPNLEAGRKAVWPWENQ